MAKKKKPQFIIQMPQKDFAVARYILEEDTEDIPLIEFEFGMDGVPTLFCYHDYPINAGRVILCRQIRIGKFFLFLWESLWFSVCLCVSSCSYTENHRDSQRKNHHYFQAATSLVIRFGADWRQAGGLYNGSTGLRDIDANVRPHAVHPQKFSDPFPFSASLVTRHLSLAPLASKAATMPQK